MSAQYLPDGRELFRTREGLSFIAVPQHGNSGWLPEGNKWTEYLYWNSPGSGHSPEWLLSAAFGHRKEEIKERNRKHFAANPEILRAIIRIKRGHVSVFSHC